MNGPPFDYLTRQNEFIEKIIIFVYDQLCKWRDNSMRPKENSEKKLNPDLPKFLTVHAHQNELPLNFYPEEPQAKRRTIDFAVCFDIPEYYNEIITVFECKRLTEKIEKNRQDEYVTGHKEITGGIQRFKFELHGGAYEVVCMIGYVENGTFDQWHIFINNCIDSLCGSPDENGLDWFDHEHISVISQDKDKCYAKSIHPRITKSDVTIHHLWIDMNKKKEVTKGD